MPYMPFGVTYMGRARLAKKNKKQSNVAVSTKFCCGTVVPHIFAALRGKRPKRAMPIEFNNNDKFKNAAMST